MTSHKNSFYSRWWIGKLSCHCGPGFNLTDILDVISSLGFFVGFPSSSVGFSMDFLFFPLNKNQHFSIPLEAEIVDKLSHSLDMDGATEQLCSSFKFIFYIFLK